MAAEPLNNIYTVLLLIGAVALTAALIMLWVTLESRYGATFGILESGKAALKAPEEEAQKQQATRAALDEKMEALKRFPATIGAPATPTKPGGPPPSAPSGG